MVSQNPSSSQNERKNCSNEQEAQKPKANDQKQNSNIRKENLNNLALEFQRSTPGSREADLNYSRFVKEAKLGKIGGIKPSNKSLSNNEYHQVLQDSKQDTLINSVSFLREKFDSKKGNIENYLNKKIKYTHKDNVNKHIGFYFYQENKKKKLAINISANQPINNQDDEQLCEELQDRFREEKSITHHTSTERRELIELLKEDPNYIFSSIFMSENSDITLQKVALLLLEDGYSQTEIANLFEVKQYSISRFLTKLVTNPLLAKIKELLDIEGIE